MSKKNLTKKIMATAFAVAGLTLIGGYAQASDFDNPTGIMKTINSKYKPGYKYKKLAPKRLYTNKSYLENASSGGKITGFAVPTTSTLDEIKSYVSDTSHHYDISTTQDDKTHSFKIGNTTYYYTPQANDTTILRIANTNTFVAGNSGDYLFTDGTNYWKYDTTKLPNSTLEYTKVDSMPETQYGVQDGKFVATGGVSFKLPNGDVLEDQIYKWTYTNPSTDNLKTHLAISGTDPFDNGGYYFQAYGSGGDGGALQISDYESPLSITADFINNYSKYDGGSETDIANGGAIWLLNSTVSITGNFIKNSATTCGGAIYNNGTISSLTGDFIGNDADYFGGAIYNDGTISSLTGDFIGNDTDYFGGAIFNSNVIGSIQGNFIGNSAKNSENSNGSGGAIFNYSSEDAGVITSINSNFIGNSAIESGGAIHNQGQIDSVTGEFIGNSSTNGYGGAIFNDGTMTLSNSTFTGNTANSKPNSIYNNYNGTINIADGATVTVNDGYDSYDGTDYQGFLNIGTGSTLNLNINNGELQTNNLGKVTNEGTINLGLDVDLTNTNSDKINLVSWCETESQSKSIIINAINLITGTGDDEISITLTSDDKLIPAYELSGSILSNITRATGVDYVVNNVYYDNTTGILTFNSYDFTSGGGTIDDVKAASIEYLGLGTTEHGKYTLSATSRSDSNPDIVVIDGTTYYFKADEHEFDDANTSKLRNLAATGTIALKEVTSSDNWIFSVGTKYYTYDKKQLSESAYALNQTDTPSHWGITVPTYNETTKHYENKMYDLVLRDQGSGDTNVYYKWTTDTNGIRQLTTEGATSSSNDLVVAYNSDVTTTTTTDKDFGTIKPETNTFQAVGVFNNSYGSTTSISDRLFKDNNVHGTVEMVTVVTAHGRIFGGAISNGGTLTSVTADFVNNQFNANSVHTSSEGDFYNIDFGGAISNYGTDTKSAHIGDIKGDFINNSITVTYDANTRSATALGGAIANYGYDTAHKSTIGNIAGDFVANSVQGKVAEGGAIYNANSTISSITGNFIGNNAKGEQGAGGAIANYNLTIGSITGDFIANSAYSSTTDASSNAKGGAIVNSCADIDSITGDFIGNSSVSNTNVFGGAIYNHAATTINSKINYITGDFIENYAKTTSETSNALGGAIFNGAQSSGTPEYRSRAVLTLGDTTFTGNYVQKGSKITPNSIYNSGIINIANGATVTINDGYDSFDDGTNAGQLNIGTGSIFNLSVDNGTPQTDNLGAVTNNGTINWDLDVDLTGTNSDKITVSSLSGTQSIIINTINLITGTGSDEISVTLTDNDTLKSAYMLSDSILSNITRATGVDYVVNNVYYDNTTGVLTFNKSGAVYATLAAAVAATDPAERTYNLSGNETVLTDLGALGGTQLIVDGGEVNKYSVSGGSHKGISVGSGQTLVLKNMSGFDGFASDNGGAIYNAGEITINDGAFTDNIAGALGGAIYNAGTTTINAATGNLTFTGNKIGTVGNYVDNDIYNVGTLNLNAGMDTSGETPVARVINLAGGITGSNGVLNINDGTAGTVTVANIAGQTTVNLKGGTFNIGENSTTAALNVTNDAILNATTGLTVDTLSIAGEKTLTNSGTITKNGDLTLTSTDGIFGGTGTLVVEGGVVGETQIGNVNFADGKYTSTGTLVMKGGQITGSGDNEVISSVNLIGNVSTGTTRIEGIVDGRNATIGALQVIADKGIITTTDKLTGTIENSGHIEFVNTNTGTIGAVSKLTTAAGEILLADVDENATTGAVYTTSDTITGQEIKVEQGNTLSVASLDHLGDGTLVKVQGGAILNTINDVVNDYSAKVQLEQNAIVKADISSTGIDKYGIKSGTTQVTLGAIKAIDAGDFQNTEFTLVNNDVYVLGESLIINTSGKTISVMGSGLKDGKVLVSESSSADKLNGAVYTSSTKNAITYVMTGGETVNTDRPALGYVKDIFTIQSSDTTDTDNRRTITATDGTKGLIVESGKTLNIDNIRFENFATGTVDVADNNYDGNYKGIITNYGTLDITNGYFAVDSSDGNAEKIAIANYGTLTSDPTTYEGAVANYRGATATITGDTFQNIDRTGYNGGAIYNEGDDELHPGVVGTLTLNTVNATGNKAANGGALYNAGTATINGGTFTGNSATALGGAIYSSTNLAINADSTNGAVSFSGNKHNTAATEVANDIYMAGPISGSPIVLALKAEDTTYKITLGDGVDGTNYNIDVNNGTTGLISIAGVKDANSILLKGGELDLTANSNATSLTASNNTTLNASSTDGLTVDTLTVADNGTFINSGNLTVTSTLANGSSTTNKGTIDNKGTLTLKGSNMVNVGDIKSTTTGNLNILGVDAEHLAKLTNNGTITSNDITINQYATLNTLANAITDKDLSIVNDGTLELIGGALSSAIVSSTGITTGHTDITTGTVTFDANVTQAVNVISGQLDNNALITGNVTVGTLNTDGTIKTTAVVNNNNAIAGNVINDWGSTFNNNKTGETPHTITGNVTNAGTFNNKGTITGTSSNSVGNHGVFNNEGSIAINVKNQGTFNNKAGATISGSFENASPESGSSITQAVLTNEGTISGGLTNQTSQSVVNKNLISGDIKNYGSINNNANATITSANVENYGSLESNANDLQATYVFNVGNVKLTGGDLQQNIYKWIDGPTGTVEIAGDVSINGKTISQNDVILTSGTFDVTSKADDDGNISSIISSANKIIAGDGILNVQDGKTGTINLGKIDTATNDKNLNIAIDADFMHGTTTNDRGIVGNADVITATSLTEGANNSKIHVSDISLVLGTSETNKHPIGTEFTVQIADGDVAKAAIDLTGTSVTSYRTGAGDILLTYDNTNGYLTGKHSTLNDAIESSVDTKLYFMDGDPTKYTTVIDGTKTLHGDSLAITTNGNDITLGTPSDPDKKDGIEIASSNQTLSIFGTAVEPDITNTVISGFETAIDNKAGGTVNLKDVTMTGNTTDIINNGEIDTSTDPDTNHGVFITGTSNINKITYNGADSAGQTTIGNADGTTDNVTIGEISQKNVNILSDGVLNISADKLQTTEGTDNAGKLNISGTTTAGSSTTLATDITDNSGTGETNVTGNVTINGSVEQKTINAVKDSQLAFDGSTTKADNINIDNAVLTIANGAVFANEAGTGATAIDLTQTDTDAPQSSIIINAITANTTLENAIVTSSDNSGYTITANSDTDGSGNPYVATINTAIADATAITATDGASLALTENAMNSMTKPTAAPITMGENSKLTLINNGVADTDAVMSNDVALSSTATTYTVDVVNTVATNSVDLTSNISGADSVNIKSGQLDVEVDNGGNIGTSDVTLEDNLSSIAFTTDNDYTVINDITGGGKVDDPTAPTSGSLVQLNGGGTNQFSIASNIEGATVVISNGELLLPNEDNLTTDPANPSNVAVASDGTLNTMNNQTSAFNDTIFENGGSLKIDADVFTKKTDNFANPTELGNENLMDISVQGLDRIYNTRSVNLTSGTGLSNLQAGAGLADLISSKYSQVVTPVRLLKGQVQQTDEGLMLQFVPTADGPDGFNSAVLAAPVAAQLGGYATQLHSYDEAFRNMDMYMLMTKEERQAMKMRNKFATASKDLIYDPTVNQYENKAGWFRPYATFENVGLDNGPRVSNVAYGTYVGGESEMYDLGHGWDGMWGAYVGYNGSHQAFGQNTSIYQNGGTLGLVGMAYKNNFFTGLTINAGANGAEASTMYGTENFSMLMAGIASKTGYNWELANGKFIIQPSALVSYSFVNTFDYRNAAGIDISSDPLHAIQIEPGVKFIGNLKNGWQPYASVSMVWNIMDKTHFHANEVALPDMSIKPFIKYGVGVRKSWGERFTAFFQTYFTNGGRNGVGLQAGFRWTVGKAPTKSTSQTNGAKSKTLIK